MRKPHTINADDFIGYEAVSMLASSGGRENKRLEAVMVWDDRGRTICAYRVTIGKTIQEYGGLDEAVRVYNEGREAE